MTETALETTPGQTTPDQALPQPARRSPPWLVPSLLLASAVASGIGQKVIFDNRALFYKDEPGFPPHPIEYLREQMWNMFYNHAIGFGTFGALLVGLIGLFIGLTISGARALTGLIIGAIVGAIVGVLIGPVGYLISNSLIPSLMDGIFKSMLVFSPVWISFGIATCVFAALLLRRASLVGNALVLGVIAGGAATIAFPILCSVLQPSTRFELIIPEEFGGRLLGYFVGAACTSLGAYGVYRALLKQPVRGESSV